MEKQLLREKDIIPTKEVLRDVLGNVYNVLEEVETRLTQSEFALSFDWHYYNDGKSWLCKVSHKKKTVFWLSVWEGFFKTTFYFMERHLEGIAALDISEQIKEDFCRMKPVGKLLPLQISFNRQEQIADLFKIVQFKL